jgi:hypothetical protein
MKRAALVKSWPTDLVAGLPAEVDAIVKRCMADEPADRYRDCHELALALEALKPASASAAAQG